VDLVLIELLGFGGLTEVAACAPRAAGNWRHFSAMCAFVLLAWAFRNRVMVR
jgi:hypothetical protein